MSFMESYKRLDNLCKDLFAGNIGVTEYINSMEKCTLQNGVENFQQDYIKLKHYRHMRNKIAHENDVTEDELCTNDDIEWIENFYRRILSQTDPLALYRKNELNLCYKYNRTVEIRDEYHEPSPKVFNKKGYSGCASVIVWLCSVSFIVFLSAWFLFNFF